MGTANTPPSRSEFTAAAQEAFSFLAGFGFQQIDPPRHRGGDPFQIWFGAGDRFVVVAGAGHGTMASVTLEHGGWRLSEVFLAPPEDRPRTRGRRRRQPGQLEQLRRSAQRLEQYGSDFLRGDLSRFLERAEPLPPYQQPPTAGGTG